MMNLDFLKAHEGCRLTAYQDQGGVWTIGYGATGPEIFAGTVWTQEQADADLQLRVSALVPRIRALVLPIVLTEDQEIAITSFCYNVGVGAFEKSTLLQLIRERSWITAVRQFLSWDHIGSKEIKGLLLRRLDEARLFLQGCP